GQEEDLLLVDPLREVDRAELLELVARAAGEEVVEVDRRDLRLGQRATVGPTLYLGVPVHDHVAQEGEDLRRAVALGLPADELGRQIDERRGRLAGGERGIDQQVLEER